MINIIEKIKKKNLKTLFFYRTNEQRIVHLIFLFFINNDQRVNFLE